MLRIYRAGSAGEENLEKEEIRQAIEALLIASSEPLSLARISSVLDGVDAHTIKNTVEEIQNRLNEGGWGFRLEPIAGGYQYRTIPGCSDYIEKMIKTHKPDTLSKSALETLSIIAYKQPIKRQDIEAIRGVSSGDIIRALIEKDLVKVVGKEDTLGKPLLYGTTKTCLKLLGLMSLKDLPNPSELRRN
jgi:segregation and condensation protein B